MLSEQQTEWIISNNLVNKGWCIDEKNIQKNVYFQSPKLSSQKNKLKGKRPDYILYETNTDKPIAIIEAKRSGSNLDYAIKQGIEYAQLLEVPLVFAMNGSYCETHYVPNGRSLILNGHEVKELIREREALKFLQENTNEVYTIPKEIIVSRSDLIKTFKNLNDTLRAEGLRAGIERFSEFANILFLKLVSENNEKPWWDSIKKQSNDDIIGYVNGYVIDKIQNTYGGNVFTHLNIKNPQTLRHIIDSIDPLTLSTIDADIKGDAFEYFLEKTTSTENDLGEYFTPRNVVKTIVNLVDPKFNETICDPFCGTGGFLTAAYNYIKENSILSPQEKYKLQNETFFGNEITTTARIAKMNMILQGDGHSGIHQIDSLANPVDDKYDVIITNMPFSQKITRKIAIGGKMKIENHISPLYYNGLAKNNGDAACVLHALRALKEGGRMALVVPEGFLFRNDLAKVREFLLSKTKLQSVISLPQGTFLPYTGVKTSILYFTNAHMPNTQKDYWFFEAKNIGVTLNNHQRKITGLNDFDKINASDIKKADKNSNVKDSMLEIGFEIIDLEKVKQNNWNLVGNVYREVVRFDKLYKSIQLKEIIKELKVKNSIDAPIWSVTNNKGFIPTEEQFKNQVASNDTKNYKLVPPYAFAYNPARINVGSIAFNNSNNIGCVSPMYIILEIIDENKLYPNFFDLLLKSEFLKSQIELMAYGSIRQTLSFEDLCKIIIPLPPLHIQQQIVDRLEYERKLVEAQEKVQQYFAYKIQNKLKLIWHDEPQAEISTDQERQMIEAQNEIITYFEQKIQNKLDSIWHQAETKE